MISSTSLFDWNIYQDIYAPAEMKNVFGERGAIESWINVERAISRTQGAIGIIPEAAAQAIDSKLGIDIIDFDRLQSDVQIVGRPVVGLVRQLTDAVGEPHNVWVHYGVSTYDIMDSGTACQIKDGIEIIHRQLAELREIWENLAEEHKLTIMIARTNGQHAQPTTFGARVANWLEEFVRHHKRVLSSGHEAASVQLGSVTGSLASVHPNGLELRDGVAAELGLRSTQANWHNARDAIAACVLNLGLVCASLARIARDVASLSSTDIGETREVGQSGRGRSSAMPHKQNPRASEFAEGVARLGRQRAMGISEVMAQEHERSGGGYTAEWMLVPDVFLLTSAALQWQIDLFSRLQIDKERMSQNIQATRGMALSENLTLFLARRMNKMEARKRVDLACERVRQSSKSMSEVLKSGPEFKDLFSDQDIENLLDPTKYIGAAPEIVERTISYSRDYRPSNS